MISIEHARSEEDIRGAADVFALAFENEPKLRMGLGIGGPDGYEMRRRLGELVTRVRVRHGAVMPIAKVDGEVVGMTLPGFSNETVWTDVDEAEWDRFISSAAPGAKERDKAYDNLKARHAPTEPHAYVIALAVHPRHHGKGIGRSLLEHVEEEARYRGFAFCALDTTLDHNVRIYERCGYEVNSEDDLNDVHFWFMRKAL